jgi:ATP/maltotriose-dependent transcriptional regulator MalT
LLQSFRAQQAWLPQAAQRQPFYTYLDQLLAVFPDVTTPPSPVAAAQSNQLPSGIAPAHSDKATPVIAPPLIEPLSAREIEVLQLVAQGHSNSQIADQLIITVGTVKRHLNNIFGKLGVSSRTQAIVQARSLRVIA